MKIDGSIQPPASVPFHIAKAYGLKATTPVRPVQPAVPATPAEPVRVGDERAGRLSEAGQRLVGGIVPGKIDFSGAQPAPSASLSIYRHPADKNAAATGVSLGRSVDVSG